jgi:hypothetical protein
MPFIGDWHFELINFFLAISKKAEVWANGNAERPWDWRKRNK